MQGGQQGKPAPGSPLASGQGLFAALPAGRITWRFPSKHGSSTAQENAEGVVPVKDIQQPVEAHIHTEWHIHQDAPLLLQPLVEGSQAVDDLHHVHRPVTGLQVMLIEDFQGRGQGYHVHCTESTGGGIRGTEENGRGENQEEGDTVLPCPGAVSAPLLWGRCWQDGHSSQNCSPTHKPLPK